MNKLIIYLFLIFSISVFSQEDDLLKNRIQKLNIEINQSYGGQKLQLMDSLCKLIKFSTTYKYDSIVQKTIEHAVSIDSINLAVKFTGERVFYLANRAGKPKEAVKVFNEFITFKFNNINPKLMARLYLNGADGYFFSGQTLESIDFYKTAGEFALKANDSVLMGKSKIYMSDAYADSGKFAEAGFILSKAEEIFENTKDTLIFINNV